MQKIVRDSALDILKPDALKVVGPIMMLSGGGLNQTFFSMGSIKCLNDNGMFYNKENDEFYFKVISAISGGTILLTFLDMATNPQYAYHLREGDWYTKYVREPLYRLTEINIMTQLLKSGFNVDKTTRQIFDTIPEYDEEIQQENTNIICEYNYIDAHRMELSCDHTDIIDISGSGVTKVKNWHLIRTSRCCLPFTNFSEVPTYDGGIIANLPITGIMNTYNTNEYCIITAHGNKTYDKYKPLQTFDLVTSIISRITLAANKGLTSVLNLTEEQIKNSIVCTASGEINPSEDSIHRGFMKDWCEIDVTTLYYNGILFCYEDALKVIENEGYIQMYSELKRLYPGKELEFKIPNPDVYRRDIVEQIVQKYKTMNPGHEFIKTFFE